MRIDKAELLRELEEKFEVVKKELGFMSSLKELNRIFFIKDAVLGVGFVSENLSRQLCSRIVDTYMNWNNYLHSLIIANPQNMFNINESKMFNEEEKKEITKLMTETMALVSTNTLVGLTKDKSTEAKFIDDSVDFWKKTFCPALIKIIKKVNSGWKKK